MKRTRKKDPMTMDNQLAYHIDQAEDHLIASVELFGEHRTLKRPTGYFSKLVRAQELVTGLNREELVRVRGAQRRSKG